jgi:glycosyltransferase involved in cell wall biosynthesis
MATLHDWWSPLRLGCHHLAEGFVRAGCEVAYVSSAISPAQLVRDPRDFRDRLARRHRGGEVLFDGRMWAHTPLSILTPHNAPLLRARWLHEEWHRLTVPNVVRSVRSRGFGHVDLLYIDAPTQVFWLDKVSFATSVARIGDRHSGFRGVATPVLELENDLVRRVDRVACTAHLIMDDVTRMGARRVLHLPNGVDFDHFHHGDPTCPGDLEGIARPIALYVGEMAAWFDFALVNSLTEALPDVSFVFIGPDRMARTRLVPRDNVHILGRRPYSLLPGYLWNADVALIPFDVEHNRELVEAVHPLKLYEYLACGLAVVATRWDELARMCSPALLCDGVDGFVTALHEVIAHPPDPAEGFEFARRADWSNRVVSLLEETGVHVRRTE